MKHLFVLLVVTIVVQTNIACGVTTLEKPTKPTPTPYDSGGPRRVNVGENFSLKVGEYVEITQKNSTAALHFREVTNDSRCPRDVVCIRAGDATVALSGVDSNGKSTELILVVESGKETSGQFSNLEVKVLELLPYPQSTTSIPRGDYKVTVVVENLLR